MPTISTRRSSQRVQATRCVCSSSVRPAAVDGERGFSVSPDIQQMIAFRKRHPILQRSRFFTGETNKRGLPDISWHGCQLNGPGWNDPECRVLAFTMGGFEGDADLQRHQPQLAGGGIAGQRKGQTVDADRPGENEKPSGGKKWSQHRESDEAPEL